MIYNLSLYWVNKDPHRGGYTELYYIIKLILLNGEWVGVSTVQLLVLRAQFTVLRDLSIQKSECNLLNLTTILEVIKRLLVNECAPLLSGIANCTIKTL